MDSLKLQTKRRNKDDDNEEKQQQQQQQPGSPPPPPPPPTSSSPTHEFSFTISLHQPEAQTTSCCLPAAAAAAEDKTKNPSSIAIDLSPADDIFFHGHLLPLHLLSHLPVSPRSSTNSMDSFTLPIKDLLTSDHHHQNPTTTTTTPTASTAAAFTDSISYEKKTGDSYNNDEFKEEGGGRAKSKSFSWLSSKWNRSEIKEEKEKERQEKKRKKLNKLDVSELLKRYMRMVRPLLSFRNRERRRSSPSSERQQTYYNSYSGNLSFRRKQEEEDYYGRSRRRGGGEFSAPASMITSPTNSGLLVAPSFSTTASHDSTMEELQAAIQAAIALCKNSIAVEEDKIKCHLDS